MEWKVKYTARVLKGIGYSNTLVKAADEVEPDDLAWGKKSTIISYCFKDESYKDVN